MRGKPVRGRAEIGPPEFTTKFLPPPLWQRPRCCRVHSTVTPSPANRTPPPRPVHPCSARGAREDISPISEGRALGKGTWAKEIQKRELVLLVLTFPKCSGPSAKTESLTASVSPSANLWLLWAGTMPGCCAERKPERRRGKEGSMESPRGELSAPSPAPGSCP